MAREFSLGNSLVEKRGGPRSGSGTPKGRVPLMRPRRGRIMGSSILTSHSEAGGNDPLHPESGPLPPLLRDDADRVGTRPTPRLMQVDCPFAILPQAISRLIYQWFMHFHSAVVRYAKFNSGMQFRFGAAPARYFSHFSRTRFLSSCSRLLTGS
jgi:hypothetical protein